jgi:Peptidase family S58
LKHSSRLLCCRRSPRDQGFVKNLLTDIAGVRVGHADDARLASGVTAVLFDQPVIAAIDVRGGGPGTREEAALDLAATVERIDAIALSGGSAFGLEAGGGVQAFLAEQGRGFVVRGAVIPIVPGAIIFDLLNGGDKAWGRFSPYRDLGYAAAAAAAAGPDLAVGPPPPAPPPPPPPPPPRPARILRSAASARGLAPPPRISRADWARPQRGRTAA